MKYEFKRKKSEIKLTYFKKSFNTFKNTKKVLFLEDFFRKYYSLLSSFAHVLRKPTVLLKTNFSAVVSLSTQKYPKR